jgi:tetratricopeptide (TPR) repeat protein
VIAALLVGLGIALWQARRAITERDRAIALADRNAAVNVFLDTLLTRAARAGPLTADQLLDRSERLIDSEIQGHAEHRAYVLGVLANCHSQLDNPARARQLLERALEAARGVADTALRDSLESRHALVRGQLGEMNDAIAATEAILARRLTTPEVRSETHGHRSVLASWAGNQAESLQHAIEALRWFRASRLLPPRQEAALLGNLGWARLMSGQVDEADRHLSEGMAVHERLGLADSPAAVQLIATAAHAQQEMGDLPRSLELFDRGLAVSARATPDAPPSPYLLANRAYTLTQMGRYADAEAGYRMAADVARQQGAALIVYSIRMCVVELFVERGLVEDAENELHAAESERTVEAPPDSPANYARQLAEARLALLKGDTEIAITEYSKALEGEQASAGTINALLGRASAYRQAAALDLALADAREALDFARRFQGRKPASFRTGLACLMMARIHKEQGDIAAARQAARTAVEQLSKGVDSAHPALALARRLSTP